MKINAIDNASDKAKDTTIGAVRTGISTAWIMGFFTALCSIFHWDISPEDLAPHLPWIMPVVAIVAGIAWRAMTFIVNKFPALGYILFGTQKKPAYVEPPAAVVEEGGNVRIIPRDGEDAGRISNEMIIGGLVVGFVILALIVLF